MRIYPIGETKACRHAASLLLEQSVPLIDHPSPDITHLLMDVPSFQADGQLRCGGYLEPMLRMLPADITILGGNLNTSVLDGYHKVDLLQSEEYLAKNAAITADCAIRLIGEPMRSTFPDSPALIIGWGRIGKSLAQKLQSLSCPVTVAARTAKDRSLLSMLGYRAISIVEIPSMLHRFNLLFNTVPSAVLTEPIPANILAVELASNPGIPKEHTIDGRGLPEKLAPLSSGKLIADTILHFLRRDNP
jgi:dipicolinate synthase subunit A